ncbi:hypothetical protein IPC624_32920 [Pseudomonas aeruginosa]|nr:hypothetical protein IPC624_32920 [Pseudomonas aeruginosa]
MRALAGLLCGLLGLVPGAAAYEPDVFGTAGQVAGQAVHCEQRVNAAIRALRITRIMVAHRPETIASADRVIVLGQGKVSLDESTARLAERQAAAAREQA